VKLKENLRPLEKEKEHPSKERKKGARWQPDGNPDKKVMTITQIKRKKWQKLNLI